MNRFRLDDFSVGITDSNNYPIIIDANQYVVMDHDTHYKICLVNHSAQRTNARLDIGGKFMGSFRLEPYYTCYVERPVTVDKKFRFFKTNSTEGQMSGLINGNDVNGLISVTFQPEVPRLHSIPQQSSAPPVMRSAPATRSSNMVSNGVTRSGLESGGTGLQGQSHQKFSNADDIVLSDKKITITLRLVARSNSYDTVTPLPNVVMSNPIPPPI